jgi:hypothetical protein
LGFYGFTHKPSINSSRGTISSEATRRLDGIAINIGVKGVMVVGTIQALILKIARVMSGMMMGI